MSKDVNNSLFFNLNEIIKNFMLKVKNNVVVWYYSGIVIFFFDNFV